MVNPQENPAEFWLITHWESEEDFHHWHKHHRSEAHMGTIWVESEKGEGSTFYFTIAKE